MRISHLRATTPAAPAFEEPTDNVVKIAPQAAESESEPAYEPKISVQEHLATLLGQYGAFDRKPNRQPNDVMRMIEIANEIDALTPKLIERANDIRTEMLKALGVS